MKQEPQKTETDWFGIAIMTIALMGTITIIFRQISN